MSAESTAAPPAAPAPRSYTWEFLASQVLMIIVTVISVYIAADQGLKQAVTFDQYQQADSTLDTFVALESEVGLARDALAANRQLLRAWLYGQFEQSLASTIGSIESFEQRIAELEAEPSRRTGQLEQLTDRLEQEQARRDEIERELAELARDAQAVQATMPEESRARFAQMAEPEPISTAMWDLLRTQDESFLLDLPAKPLGAVARLFRAVGRFEQPWSGDSGAFVATMPTLVRTPTGAKARLRVIDQLLASIDETITPALAAAIQEQRQVLAATRP